MSKKRIWAIIKAILRQVLFPHDVYDRNEDGTVKYQLASFKLPEFRLNNPSLDRLDVIPTTPVPIPWASLIAKALSLIITFLAIFFLGDKLDITLIQEIVRSIFGA